MVVSFGQRPPSMRLRSHDPCRTSPLTDHTGHDKVTHESSSGSSVTPLQNPIPAPARASRAARCTIERGAGDSPCNTRESVGQSPRPLGPIEPPTYMPVELNFLSLSGEQECANSHSPS